MPKLKLLELQFVRDIREIIPSILLYQIYRFSMNLFFKSSEDWLLNFDF